MKKIGLFGILLLLCSVGITWAKTIDEELADIASQITAIEKSMAPLKSESGSLSAKISSAKVAIASAENQMKLLDQRLVDKEADMEVQRILMSERVRRYYINSKKYSPLMILLSAQESSGLLRQYALFQAVISQDKSTITNYITDLKNLNLNKEKVIVEKNKIAVIKKDMESRFGFLAGELKKAEAYKQVLSQKQQQLIAEKTAMFNTSVGDVSSSDDPASRADFNPGFSPAFAAFSFGAPHRKGMSQYGAYGRAKSGQGYETILKAYYGDVKVEKMDSPDSIKTSIGTLPFENNYLVGIAEMPASWGDNGGYEALKAQAIAARTYAINSTNNLAGTICVTEACQVYSKSRFNSPNRWKQAVEDTKGMVVKSNKTGKVFSTMYASTSGGSIMGYSSADHSTPSIWDTKCGNQGCWPNDAYEKIAGSSWYYKGWYKNRDNVTAGRTHPWLNNEEFSDIINAVLYYDKTGDSSRLSQIENCLKGCDSNAWSKDELRRQVSDKSGPISSINSISVDYSTSGFTKSVRISTDKGDFNFSADTFKLVFNLRSPGALHITFDWKDPNTKKIPNPSLFNIVKK